MANEGTSNAYSCQQYYGNRSKAIACSWVLAYTPTHGKAAAHHPQIKVTSSRPAYRQAGSMPVSHYRESHIPRQNNGACNMVTTI